MNIEKYFDYKNTNTSLTPDEIETVITQFLMHCIDALMHDSQNSSLYLTEAAVAFEESFIQLYGKHPLAKQLAFSAAIVFSLGFIGHEMDILSEKTIEKLSERVGFTGASIMEDDDYDLTLAGDDLFQKTKFIQHRKKAKNSNP